MREAPVLLTGATGYVGGRLLPLLVLAGFDPRGLSGLAYWYSIWPLHQIVLAGMLREIARRAESLHGRTVDGR